MGTTLEVLKTRLEAETAQYNAAMRGARKTTDKSTRGINKSIASMVVKFASFAAAVMVARKAYRMFTAGLSRIDKLAKTARFLGITTEALAGLQHLSNLTGVSMGNLETAMMRMTRAIGEASTGALEYLEPFQRIGVSTEELLRLAPEKQMAKIAEGITTLGTQTEQASVAMEIFGRSGMRMRNLLREGSKGFLDAQREAKRFGLAVTDIDSKKVEDANDAVTRMKAAFTGMVNTIVVEASPAVEFWANVTSEALSGVGEQERILAASTAETTKAIVEGWAERGSSIMEFAEVYPQMVEVYANYLATMQTMNNERANDEKDTQEKINTWALQGEEQRKRWAEMGAGVRAETVLGSFRDMVSAIGTESRTMFEISKGLAYAEAVVNTASGITKNLQAYPQPYAGIMAGITAAAGAAQIAAIAATQYQKGGGGAGAGAATAGAGAGAAAAAGGGEAPLGVDVVVQGIQGEGFSNSQVRDLIGRIDDELSDGVRMRSVTISG